MLPKDLQLNGLRRNDDAMKNKCRAHKFVIIIKAPFKLLPTLFLKLDNPNQSGRNPKPCI